MISALLAILKFLGIMILVLLGIVLVILLLVLFVPIRYKITAHRKMTEEAPIVAEVKVTWLLHILNVAFSYPAAAYVRVRLFCFTVFKTGQLIGKEAKSDAGSEKETEESRQPKERKKKAEKKEKKSKKEKTEAQIPEEKKQEPEQEQSKAEEQFPADDEAEDGNNGNEKSIWNKIDEFFRKLLELLRNIRYTITGIYDKIKHIVNNIHYYINIIRSDTFGRVWAVCSVQVLSLLKSIGPRKISGTLLIGTGDPASTGQVMAVYGILYPLIGDHIDITPDFEQKIVEGNLLIKGKITVLKALKTAWIIYFNRDMRRLIKLFKKGGSLNGRE